MSATITAGRDDLAVPFIATEKIAARKHHIEAFTWVRFWVDGDTGWFEASDGISSVRTAFDGFVASEAVSAMLPKSLTVVLKAVPPGPVQMSFSNGNVHVEGTAAGSSSFDFGLFAGDPIELDTGADEDWTQVREVDPLLVDALLEAAKFAGTDPSRQALMNVHLVREGSSLAIEATDSFRMYRRIAPDPGLFDDVTVPNIGVLETRNFGSIYAKVTDDKVYLTDQASRWYSTRRIHGQYPALGQMIGQVLDDDGSSEIGLHRQDTLDALKQISVIALKNQAMTVGFGAELTLGLKNVDGQAQASVPAELDGRKDGPAGFNLEHFVSGLEAFDDDIVSWRYIDPLRPSVFVSGDETKVYMLSAVRV